MYNVSNELVAISGAVHRELNDIVDRIAKQNIGWEGSYIIYLGSDGQIEAKLITPNPYGLTNLVGFRTGLGKKLAFLPTPKFVKGSKQRIYICFCYELPELMEEWMKDFVGMLG